MEDMRLECSIAPDKRFYDLLSCKRIKFVCMSYAVFLRHIQCFPDFCRISFKPVSSRKRERVSLCQWGRALAPGQSSQCCPDWQCQRTPHAEKGAL